GKVLLKRVYTPGRADHKYYAGDGSEYDHTRYWDSHCWPLEYDSGGIYCVLPGYSPSWDTSVGRW
ncbi:MAG: hypothetical protein NTX07_01345, partial [Solirubrobacterales bacterium]|nr:hypothetical protein [Solirubrobacterales bacterium]